MTGNRVARAILGIIFVALLVAPLVLKRLSARRTAEKSSADAKTTLARHGFYLQEVSQAAGIRFVHQAPELDPKLESHHAGGRFDGRVGVDRRFRSRRLVGHLRRQQRHRQQERFVPQSGRRHFQGRGRRTRHRGCQSAGHRSFHRRGVGRLRQRRLRRPVPHQVGTPRALPQRPGPRLHPRKRASRPAALDQCQHRDLV